MSKIKILHSADIQIKARTSELFTATELHLQTLEHAINEIKPTVYIISGDLFEFGNTAGISEAERKLMYNHLSRVLKIDSIKELVIIDGNHDIHPEQKSQEITRDNSLDIFSNIISTLDVSESNKLKYFNASGIYSGYLGLWDYYVVSLRDGEKFPTVPENQKNPIIALWHGMLKEYVDSVQLPIRQDLYKKLISVNQFPEGSWILSGDIHKRLKFSGERNQKFIYPGSTMQHTHSEGKYITIGNEVSSKYVKPKALSVYEFDSDVKTMVQLPNYELPDSIQYTTIVLDHLVPFGVIKNQLNTVILQPADIQIIKIKTANTLLKHENEIREIISTISAQYKYVLSFDYEKYVQQNVYNNATAETITKIIEEKSEELKQVGMQKSDDIITSKNIDKLILSNQQIIELFKAVLKPVLKTIKNEFPNDITTEQIESDIVAIFSEELDKSLNQSGNRYNIKFLDIYTNGFMLLGENTINLDIPGIIRILGTNGIGKTTLYNMMRWVIKGDLFEGMSKVTKVRNACMCFNNTKLTQNFVEVILNQTINGQRVQIKRTLLRKWKTNDLSKINPEKWEESVATIDQTLEVTIYKRDTNEPVVVIGEKAQKHIDLWFGKTVDNIMILNHPKLERILKSDPSELNELILEFIGVDYLKKLDVNLELVKSELMTVSKPKRDAESIFEAKVDCNMYIKNIDSTIQEYNVQIDKLESEILEEKTNQTTVNDKLRNLGNVAQKVITTTNEINVISNDIDNFEIKQLLEPKEIDIVKPQEPILAEYQNDKAKHQETYDKIQIVVPKLESANEQIFVSINNKRLNAIIGITEMSEKYQKDITDNENKTTSLFLDIQTKIESIIHELEELRSKNNEQINAIASECNTIINRNFQIESDIENGVCSKCNRPFADDYEEHRIKLNLEKNENTDKFESLQKQLSILQGKTSEYDNQLKHYNSLKVLSIQKSDDIFTNSHFMNFEEFKIWQDKYVGLRNSYFKINDTLNGFETQKLIYDKFNNVRLFTVEYIDNLKDIPQTFKDDIDALKINLDKIQKLKAKESQVLIAIQEIDNSISKAQNEYSTELSKYNSALETLQRYNNSISEKNQEIMNHNNKLILMRSEKELKEKELEILELQLPEYNKLYAEYNQISDNITELSKQLEYNKQQIHVKELNRKEYDNQLSLLDTEYQNLIKYTKNQIIWKIYSKLIKDNFKEIVFDYYRTYLNNTLNYLLSDVSFKLYWNINSELTFSNIRNGYNAISKVQLASNMEIAFMGLSLIYTIHVLNVKNNISHIFIDELSGALNKGVGLSYDAKDYQELFVKIINKFKDKTIFIIDHHIQNLFETVCYQVTPDKDGSIYRVVE